MQSQICFRFYGFLFQSIPYPRLRDQRARIGGDRKFSKMVELLVPQNCKMVELLGVKFAQKDLSQNFRGTYGAATDFKLKNDIIQQI